ncbi:MAG: respiratory nitrate reductase subunit gamma [Gammaproteobacteria bacterium]|nr:respiratory nitrate reductase subunit gamma [Gammaproteobacteria bacterium]MDH3370848.1 respiratory nitrate reductase subunit gamma [Gammaproteobacteria bacterium]MDH3406507.1 respiratory nitrate reductase subunit gamma [Gammaproteobacteria bacterium]MDH3562762.1 respiratory nitrate reductase subunit gamma [Gammaproteobacteria bacterium]MDH5487622.1 respiratory nitrate reductase subunit gamma [Gammaproteobacteria bacterium]
MSAVTVIYALLFYVATAILVIGVARKIYIYARAPQPLKIPTTPAPTTRLGVAARMVREVTVFESLFKANKWTWLFGWIFHFCLFVELIWHLRYFTEPVLAFLPWMQWFINFTGYGMVLGLLGLWGRRFLVDRVRYISGPSDHLMLALLVAIGASGLAMKFLVHTDIVALKAFFIGLMTLNWQRMPADPLLLIHLTLVALLMIIFPVSKLLHAPGVFFSPTRNQVDNPREQRWVAGWTAKLDNTKAAGN